MCRKIIIFSILVFILNNFNPSFANNYLNGCKEVFLGICLDGKEPNLFPKNEPQPKKITNEKVTVQMCYDSYGFWPVFEYYAFDWVWGTNTKTRIFISHIEPGSSAAKEKLQFGDEILAIGGVKASKLDIESLSDYLNKTYYIHLTIKPKSGKKRKVVLAKKAICSTVQIEPLFNSYWKQIDPGDVDFTIARMEATRSVKLSPKSRNIYYKIYSDALARKEKREQFRTNFNFCLENYSDNNEIKSCLNQMVNRAITAEQHQEHIDALNNHSHALRNQYMYHSGHINVYHY